MIAPSKRPYALERQGILLSPTPGRRDEAGGVLNPTVYRAGDRTLIMYRAVDTLPENFSRLALAELTWEHGTLRAERLAAYALEPMAPYELLTPEAGSARSPGGGCEDPRVTDVEGRLMLCYTGYGGARAPRIALADSKDGVRWERLGLARFSLLTIESAEGPLAIDLNAVDNKDAMLFPERIGGRYAMLHRPMFDRATMAALGQTQSIWVSYSDDLIHWDSHRLIAAPAHPWERLKLGGGTQPVRVPQGWLIVYHGVDGDHDGDPNRRYSAGAMVLDAEDLSVVTYRSPEPILAPDAAEEQVGVVNNVVFPTGLWPAPDGMGLLVAYGMADRLVGWARMRDVAGHA